MALGRFLIKRTVHGALVVWGIVTLVFALRFVTPGSPLTTIAPLDASPALKREIARELALNQPIYVQYTEYLWGLLHLDMGRSYVTNTSVSAQVFARLPITLELAVTATIVALVFSIPLGVISATNRNSPADYAATSFSLAGISTPNFWLGLMLVLVFAVGFDLLPVSGQARVAGQPVLFLDVVTDPRLLPVWLAHLTLPAITLGTYFTALITRLTRSGMLEELGKSYVRALRSKGLPEARVRYRHVLKNTLIPVLTVLGLQLGTLIGGAVITERVFAWHGLGSLLIDAINDRDWMLIQGSLIVIGVGFVLLNILVDALYAAVNPEVSVE